MGRSRVVAHRSSPNSLSTGRSRSGRMSLLNPQNIARAVSVGRALGRLASNPSVRQAASSLGNRMRRAVSSSSNRRKARVVVKKPLKSRYLKRRGYGLPSGPIVNVQGGSRVTPQDTYKVNVKSERGLNYVGWHAMYPGGWTHPTFSTVSTLSFAIVRFLMKKAKIDFGNFLDPVMLPLVVLPRFSLFFYWKAEGVTSSNLTREDVDMSFAQSFEEVSQRLADRFVAAFGVAGDARRMTAIGINPITTALQPNENQPNWVACQYYNASDLFISIKGESTVQVQNRTLADGSGDQTDATNIFNNPLRGKYYTFKNGRPIIRNVGTAVQIHKTYFPSDGMGLISQQDREGVAPGTSNFPTDISNVIRKPPSGVFFKNCVTTKHVQVLPGAILSSRVECTVNKSLMNWMMFFRTKFQQSPEKTLSFLGNTDDPLDINIGVSHMYGLEKMVDTDFVNNNQLQIGLEHNLFHVGKVVYKPRASTCAVIKIST